MILPSMFKSLLVTFYLCVVNVLLILSRCAIVTFCLFLDHSEINVSVPGEPTGTQDWYCFYNKYYIMLCEFICHMRVQIFFLFVYKLNLRRYSCIRRQFMNKCFKCCFCFSFIRGNVEM